MIRHRRGGPHAWLLPLHRHPDGGRCPEAGKVLILDQAPDWCPGCGGGLDFTRIRRGVHGLGKPWRPGPLPFSTIDPAALADRLVEVLRLHRPGRARWWRARCVECGRPYPCATREAALGMAESARQAGDIPA